MFELLFTMLIVIGAFGRLFSQDCKEACEDDDIPYYSLDLRSGSSLDERRGAMASFDVSSL